MNNIQLLPYIREDVFGHSTDSQQIMGWEIQKFNIDKKWSLSQGENVTVAVIDTGCDLYHDDIKTNLVQGKNFVNPKQDPIDKNGHGTHVSSTIAAENNGLGMVGVAPKTKIMPVKALNDKGSGSLSNIIDAIIWSANQRVDFITMSLGSHSDSPQLYNAIKYATSKGCVIFCAAGNDGPSKDICYPAKYSETISIGAIDKNLERTRFTCSGEELDFLAPGHEIFGAVPGNKYALMSGTSMSNPFAVGCSSLLLSYLKKINSSKIPKTAPEYIDIFKNTAIKLSNPEYRGIKRYEGYGIILPEWKLK